MLFQIFRYLEVKARIIDENDHIGFPFHDVALAQLHIAQYGRQMEQYGNETHKSEVAVVSYERAAFLSHHVAAKEAEHGMRVVGLNAMHETRGMKVATGFAYDKVISHRFQSLICPIISCAVTSMVVGVMAT